MARAACEDPAEPLRIASCLQIEDVPVFVRSVSRRGNWQKALKTRDAASVAHVFESGQDAVSLWLVASDSDLRRAVLAINENRALLDDQVYLLPILPQELDLAGVAYRLNVASASTRCPPAKNLHHDADMDDTKRVETCRILLETERQVAKCTRPLVRQAIERSQDEGCFSVSPQSRRCQCGASR